MESAPEAWTVTSLVNQPLVPGVPAVTDSVADGAVLSSFTMRAGACVVRPASFVHDPCRSLPVVSVPWMESAVHVTGVATVSVPVVRTVTSLVYQPLVPGVPEITAEATPVGPVLSSFTVSGVAYPVRPAPFLQLPLNVAPTVSAVWN